MKTKLLLVSVLFVFPSIPAQAQSRRLLGGSAGGSKYQFFYETFLDPAMPQLGNLGGGTIGGEGTIHRLMWDREQRVYFGYDASIESLPDANTYRITFGQLTMSAEDAKRALGSDVSSWTSLPAPDWGGPAVRTIRTGEVLSLDLLTNSKTGQRIVDYVTVQGSSLAPSNADSWHANFIYETGAPRDFRAEDAALEIRLPRVSVNGSVSSSLTTEVVVFGPAVWFYLPMYGRFILSLTPHPELGFRNAGEIRGSALTFTEGNDTFNLVSSGRIAPGSGPFNLYVLHDSTYKPIHPLTNPADSDWGSAEHLDQLIAK